MAGEEQPDNRIRSALNEAFDSGNAMADAFEALDDSEDGYEFEQALMGIPETIMVSHRGILKDLDYYISKLRRLYVEKAIVELDHQEDHHTGTGRLG